VEPQYVEESEESGEQMDLANPLMLDELVAATDEVPDDWPFHLVSRRMWEYHNSWGQGIQRLRDKIPVNPAFMHPEDLAMLGVGDGQQIRIVSDGGVVEATARQAPELRRGVISMAHCWGDALGSEAQLVGSNTNRLVDHDHPGLFVGIPRMSAIGVRVEVVEASAPGSTIR
jgi:anaerobic selenocysteine-containing dehydrogenase